MCEPIIAVRNLVRREFKEMDGVISSQLSYAFTAQQMALLSSALNGFGRSQDAQTLALSITPEQIQTLQATMPTQVLCLIVLILTLEISLFEGETTAQSAILFYKSIRRPDIPALILLNPGGCGGLLYNRLFTLSGFPVHPNDWAHLNRAIQKTG